MLASCYEYVSPPIAKDAMKPIISTELGAKLFSLLSKMTDDENLNKAKQGMTEDTMVLEISKDFLLYQETNEKAKTGKSRS